ncbi:protein phosphatase inhibitor 2-like [Heterodontus francisci]|uniref:protein phosphatase inhibitor 2-like n=1 Tax=Heterodontus francisci TaxID=7792 RepID=UPI00355AE336
MAGSGSAAMALATASAVERMGSWIYAMPCATLQPSSSISLSQQQLPFKRDRLTLRAEGEVQQLSASQLCGSHSAELGQKKSQSWDEMNIMATYKPQGKDYGHMPINEAKTPYRYNIDDEAGSSSSPVFSMDELASRMNTLNTRHEKVHISNTKMRDSDEDEPPFVDLEKVRQFEFRRKQIYDEGLNIKRARELIAREELDDHDDSDYNRQCKVAKVLGFTLLFGVLLCATLVGVLRYKSIV